jgi:hypothetical protein
VTREGRRGKKGKAKWGGKECAWALRYLAGYAIYTAQVNVLELNFERTRDM